MPKRAREPPEWLYNASTGKLEGPEPVPAVPPVTSIHGGELGATADHDVAEVDQELRVVALGKGFVPHPWHEDRVERPFHLSGWEKGMGWYARFRRCGRRFELTHVWADGWAATTYGRCGSSGRRPDGDTVKSSPSRDDVSDLSGAGRRQSSP